MWRHWTHWCRLNAPPLSVCPPHRSIIRPTITTSFTATTQLTSCDDLTTVQRRQSAVTTSIWRQCLWPVTPGQLQRWTAMRGWPTTATTSLWPTAVNTSSFKAPSTTTTSSARRDNSHQLQACILTEGVNFAGCEFCHLSNERTIINPCVCLQTAKQLLGSPLGAHACVPSSA